MKEADIVKGCGYCTDNDNITIQEAGGRNKLVNEQIEIIIDCYVPVDNNPILAIDYETKEASQFYIDISYCPFCGRNLKGESK